MLISQINPFIRYSDCRVLSTAPFSVCSYDCRLLFMQSGSMIFHCGRSSQKVTAGTLLVWQPGQPYRFEQLSDSRAILFNFDFDQSHADIASPLSVVGEGSCEPEKALIYGGFEDCPDFSSLMIRKNMQFVEGDLLTIVTEMRERKKFYREICSSVLKRVLTDAARCSFVNGTELTVERVIAYIHDNFSRNITNKDIAQSVNYHEYYVNKLIYRQTGLTLHRYLTSCRVRYAAKLLASTASPVSEIAELCGFGSSTYFVCAFRAQFGEPPNVYRQRRNGLI